MASMSRTTSGSSASMRGFSILQPTVGAPLCWMPAVGTKELDQLINAYLPGPGSAQEKRAAVSIDFFEYSARTGESFKYYPVNPAAASPQATSSSFASPALSDLTYSGSSPSQASTPAPSMARAASRRSAASRAESTDSFHLPGMKILTMDGQDVTNTVSRGCKTKEQREHAHLMRVLKACDACKRKKIRCDPSHKKRTASHAKSEATTKPAAKKAKKSPPTPASQAAAFTPAPDVSLDMDMATFEAFPTVDQPWDEFLTFNDEAVSAPVPQDFYGAVPQDFDFFFGQEYHQFSPAVSGSSGSFDSPAQPLTPDNSHVLPQVDFATFTGDSTLAFVQAGGQEPMLPYMAPGGAHGSNYVDFHLYSPTSSFIDEEPQKLKAGDKRKASALQSDPSARLNANSLGSLDEPAVSTGMAHDQQWRFDHSGFANATTQGSEPRVLGAQDDLLSAQLEDGSASLGSQSPFHADNAGQSEARIVMATRLNSRPLQQMLSGRNSPVTPAVLLEDRERNGLLPQSPGLGSPATATWSQQCPRTVSPTELQAANMSRQRISQQSSISSAALPLSEALVLTGLDRQGEGSLQRGVLPVGGLREVRSSKAANHSGLAAPFTTASRDTAVVRVLVPFCGSSSSPSPSPSQVLRRPGEVEVNGTAAAVYPTSHSTTGLSPSPRVPGHGQERQLLHGATSLASAASSSPQRLLSGEDAVTPTPSPVRQLLGWSASPAQLVAFGLVSMLLIVAITSQLQRQAPTIFAHLLSPNSFIILLSLFSTLSSGRQQRASSSPASAEKGSAAQPFDSFRSLFSHSRVAAPCRDRSAWTGPARVPVACL